MLHKTNGIVLRSVKYGESSLVTTIFTELHGVQTYMVQGVRSSKARQNKAGNFQPGTLLDLVVYLQPQKNMQRIREFQPAFIYNSMQESVVKNSITLFSVELLLRTLPEHAPLPALFDFTFQYFVSLDQMPVTDVANFPLFFIIELCRISGYELIGSYSKQTPYLNIKEGGFSAHPPSEGHTINEDYGALLTQVLKADDYDKLKNVPLNASIRMHLLDWYISFLQEHSHSAGNIRSLAVLKAILH